MYYLKDYGLSEEDINMIYDNLSEDNWLTIAGYETRVRDILDYLKELNITDVKNMLLQTPYIFDYDVNQLKKYINECETENIIDLLRKDVTNFDLL